jgi:hypothetical protein
VCRSVQLTRRKGNIFKNEESEFFLKTLNIFLGVVIHAYNPSYSEGRGKRMVALGKVGDPI